MSGDGAATPDDDPLDDLKRDTPVYGSGGLLSSFGKGAGGNTFGGSVGDDTLAGGSGGAGIKVADPKDITVSSGRSSIRNVGVGPLSAVTTLLGWGAKVAGAPTLATLAFSSLGRLADKFLGNPNLVEIDDLIPGSGGRSRNVPRNVPVAERTPVEYAGQTTPKAFQADFTRAEQERANTVGFSEGGEDQRVRLRAEEGPPTMVSSSESTPPPVVSPSTVSDAVARAERNRRTRERARKSESFETLLGFTT